MKFNCTLPINFETIFTYWQQTDRFLIFYDQQVKSKALRLYIDKSVRSHEVIFLFSPQVEKNTGLRLPYALNIKVFPRHTETNYPTLKMNRKIVPEHFMLLSFHNQHTLLFDSVVSKQKILYTFT